MNVYLTVLIRYQQNVFISFFLRVCEYLTCGCHRRFVALNEGEENVQVKEVATRRLSFTFLPTRSRPERMTDHVSNVKELHVSLLLDCCICYYMFYFISESKKAAWSWF